MSTIPILKKIPEVKPGMTANMTIKVAERKGVLVVSSGAITNKNGLHFVKIINDPKKKTYHGSRKNHRLVKPRRGY